jgi:hypothetical protein
METLPSGDGVFAMLDGGLALDVAMPATIASVCPVSHLDTDDESRIEHPGARHQT